MFEKTLVAGKRTAFALVACVLAATSVWAQDNRIDRVTPVAPELAGYGKYNIGVRTITATNRNRPDILNTKPGGQTARYDRTLPSATI